MLDAIGYRYWDETDNPAYQLFFWVKPSVAAVNTPFSLQVDP